MQSEQSDESFFETLGLSLASNVEQELVTRRVVVVGDALSGKRTFTSLILAAARQHIPPSSSSKTLSLLPFFAKSNNRRVSGGNRIFLRKSCMEGPEITGSISGLQPSSQIEASSTLSSSFSSSSQPAAVESTVADDSDSDRRLQHLPHGAGIAHAFIIQRIQTCRGPFVIATGGGGTSAVVTEFFCCDAPGALAIALPTVEALETSVVLIVIDTSVPWRVQDQLRRWHGYLDAHVMRTLEAELPTQDKVRRMHMVEQQQQFWSAQQQARGATRRRWCEREGVQLKECGDHDTSTAPLPMLQVPKDGVSPLRSIIVCTKTDHLERLSRELEKSARKGFYGASCNKTPSLVSGSTAAWVSSSLLSVLHSTGLTLLDLMSQLLRKEAIKCQSAIVAVGSSVNTIATSTSVSQQRPTATTVATTPLSSGGGDVLYEETCVFESSMNGHNVFVHPFYRGLWLYIFHLLCDSVTKAHQSDRVLQENLLFKVEANHTYHAANSGAGDVSVVAVGLDGSFVDEAEAQVSAQFYPHAFLPHGVDHLGLLSPFVTSTDAVTLESIFDAGVEAAVEDCEDSLLCLHNSYMQQIATILADVDHDEEAMIWDKL